MKFFKGRFDDEEGRVSTRRLLGSPLWMCLFLLIVVLACFWQVRSHEFVNFDDDTYVTANPMVQRGIAKDSVAWAFETTVSGNWHPLTWISHMLDVQLYGLRPGPHHMTSVLIHAVNAMLLFLLIRSMTGLLWPPFLVAVLFALHPMHVESVAWVSERKDVLSTFFFILTIFSYVRFLNKRTVIVYLEVVLFFILGLMSKPMLVTLPCVLVLLDYWPLGRIEFKPARQDQGAGFKETITRSFLEKAPLFLITAIFCVVVVFAQNEVGAVMALEHDSLWLRISNALVSYNIYLVKLFVPVKLSVFYPRPESIAIWRALGSLVSLSAITAVCCLFYRKKPYLIVGWLWFIGTLVPVIGLVQVGWQAMADRYSYIPYIGLSVSLSWLLRDYVEASKRKRTAAICTAAVLFAMAWATYGQIGVWQNSISLFYHALKLDKNNPVAHQNLGSALADRGLLKPAIKHYKRALEIEPRYCPAIFNLGTVYQDIGDKRSAMAQYFRTIEVCSAYRPAYDPALYKLAMLFFDIGRYDKAIEFLKRTVEANPSNYVAYNSLGAAFWATGEKKLAARHFQKALGINPAYSDARKNLQAISSKP